MKKHTFLKVVSSITLVSLLLFPAAAYAAETAPALDASSIKKYLPEDVKDHEYAATIHDMLQSGLVNGYVDEAGNVTVKPENNITRAEFVKILVKALDLDVAANPQEFSDVKPEHWHYDFIRTASSHGLINGIGEGQFAPDRNITRAEIAKIVVRAFEQTVPFTGASKQFTDVPDDWSKPYVEKASQAGIVNGYDDTHFGPNDKATRVQAMLMLQRALHKENTTLPDETMLKNLVLEMNQKLYEVVTEAVYGSGETGDTVAEEVYGNESEEADTNVAEAVYADYSEIKDISDEYATGFYHDVLDLSADILTELSKLGIKIEQKHVADWTLEVLWKSNRYAAVKVNGDVYDVTVTKDGQSRTHRVDASSTVFLKKMNDGSWKVYGGEVKQPLPTGHLQPGSQN
ncbi:S-layer homology domain-containing protein [Effusibacillus lacus]|uniref:SLH domain-containing protein n=2 Tax=Effusibacillus lacus TaxID=1348429 RepID=A0A292YN04_9BACL|nr:S-layer homology domain-containing protein [Effusibacillus lacus]GAX90279.1 hypothetical protein EFBL_1905 [Effusibacillus lacus]